MHALAAIHPPPGFDQLGVDEGLYRAYTSALILQGIQSYPDLATHYNEVQARLPGAILPPTRFLYVGSAYLWHLIFRNGPLTSLYWISSLFSMLLLGLATLFAWRLAGTRVAICVSALMAFAPTQIHMSQHALIDGFFAFWATLALWFLWENLQRPNSWPWLLAYGTALALMVLTKENAMFAYVALLALLLANYWLHFGKVTLSLCLTTVLGALVGVFVLVALCGGMETTVMVFRLLVSKASVLDYAIKTGDGPWYRYLVDLMIVSPVILVLALGAIFRLRQGDTAAFYLLIFIAGSFILMANVRYGMNLRYTNMWDFPLRFLAILCLVRLSAFFPRSGSFCLALSVIGICAIELRQYEIFFVRHDLYELTTEGLLRAVNILK